MKSKRKRHKAEFKAQVAIEAMKELKTMSELAGDFDLHPNQIGEWKKVLKQRAGELFKTTASAGERDKDKLIADLYKKIGKTQMELEWLKKKYAAFQSKKGRL
jgi:transposase-like protein